MPVDRMTNEYNDKNLETKDKADVVYNEREEKLLNEIWSNLSRGKSHRSEWRRKAKESYEFYALKQWSKEARDALLADKKIPITFDVITKIIALVSGIEKQNRREVRFSPRETSDSIVADELLTPAVEWVNDQTDAEYENSECFEDCLISGEGWSEIFVDYAEDPNGMIRIENVDPFSIVVDPLAKKRNYVDKRWVARVEEYTIKEFKALWPDVMPSRGRFWSSLSDTEQTDYKEEQYFGNDDQPDDAEDVVSVIMYQWAEDQAYYRVLSENEKMVEFDSQTFKRLKDKIEQSGLRYMKFKKRIVKQALVNGRQVLSETDIDKFTLIGLTGLRDKIEGQWFGLIELLKDPQRWANKWLSQILHIINTNAKGSYFYEGGAFKDPRSAERDMARPDKLIALNPGGLQKILRRDPPPYPDGLDRLLQYALSAVNEVTGISQELLGLSARDQPGVVEDKRRQASMSILGTFFDAFGLFLKDQGKLLAYYIKEYISDGRLVRVVGDKGAQYVPLLKNKVDFEYDIIVDDSPMSPNQRDKTFAILSNLLPMALQAGIRIPTDIIDYMPIPEALKQSWKAELSPEPDPQMIQKQAEIEAIQRRLTELEMQRLQVTNIEMATRAEKNLAQASKDKAAAEENGPSMDNASKIYEASLNQALEEQRFNNEERRKDLSFINEQQRKNLSSSTE